MVSVLLLERQHHFCLYSVGDWKPISFSKSLNRHFLDIIKPTIVDLAVVFTT